MVLMTGLARHSNLLVQGGKNMPETGIAPPQGVAVFDPVALGLVRAPAAYNGSDNRSDANQTMGSDQPIYDGWFKQYGDNRIIKYDDNGHVTYDGPKQHGWDDFIKNSAAMLATVWGGGAALGAMGVGGAAAGAGSLGGAMTPAELAAFEAGGGAGSVAGAAGAGVTGGAGADLAGNVLSRAALDGRSEE